MRYNKDTFSTARTIGEMDIFKDYKSAQLTSRADMEALQRAIIENGWSSTLFNHSRSN